MVLRIGSDSGSDRPGSDWYLRLWCRIIILRKAPESDPGFVNDLCYTSEHAYFRLSSLKGKVKSNMSVTSHKLTLKITSPNLLKQISTCNNFKHFSFIFSLRLEFFSPSWWETLPLWSSACKSSPWRHGRGTKCIAWIKRFRRTWYEMICISLIPFEV